MSEEEEMQEREAYFDDRLCAHGIDYVAWDNAGLPDHQLRTVTLRFPVENAKPIEIAERVIPNAEESEYQAINVNEVHISGFEMDLAARPLPNLDIDAAFGYTKSKIVDFNGTSAYIGESLPYQPRYTLNLGATRLCTRMSH